ncbi:nuclear transport factor 2 family protein [Aquirufa sp.]|jgi:protease I|uniref:nuclear transport factor 2 family protein n=1 Tax=Aquirufa sp. TaxID=2676249 RepID=UPI0034EA33CC
MKNVFVALFCLVGLTTFAQSEDEGIKSAINSYTEGFTKGDTASLGRAFASNALLRNLNTSTGKIADTPLKRFIAGMPAGGAKATGSLVNYSYAGTSAVATVEFKFDDFKYIDLLSLMKINEDWKIVCRVYSRVGLDVSVASSQSTKSGATKAAPAPAAKKPNAAAVKPKKDDGW